MDRTPWTDSPRTRRAPAPSVGVLPAAVALAWVGTACGGDAPEAPPYTVRDSAGVSIVANRAPVWTPGEVWRVDAEPVLSLGGLDGPEETQFFRLTSPGFRADGSIVVGDGGNQRVSAFAPDGAHLWSQGREGEGPGEYGRLVSVVVLGGDSVLAYDLQAQRCTVLDPAGRYARDFTPEVPEGAWFSWPVGRVAPGTLVATGQAVFDVPGLTEGQAVRQAQPYHLSDTEGVILDSLPALPGPEQWYVARRRGERILTSIAPIPFGRDSWLTAGPNRIVNGSSERAEWTERDARGAPARIVRLEVPTRTVTGDDWERAREAELATEDEPAARARVRDRFGAMPRPDTWPLFGGLLLDDRDHLWVRQYTPPWEDEGPVHWWVFDPDGILLGEVTTPAGLAVAEIRGDRILGRTTDELGVQRVEVYRIVGREG